MKKIILAVHGGAGTLPAYLKKHRQESAAGIEEALLTGYQLLKQGKPALDAVEAAAMKLEDNPFFNAGRGSALNERGEVEMDAAIMDGKTLSAGAVSMVRQVKNPIFLARKIMTKTKHVFLSGYGALEVAQSHDIQIAPDSYFVTDYQLDIYQETLQRARKKLKHKDHGTIGVVALDLKKNLAAATSTGGTDFSLPGRIGDSCVIGAGCYANNKTCAISGTGEGEYLIRNVVGHTISMLMECKGYRIQKACDVVIHKRKGPMGEMGVIALDKTGKVGISFNTKSMRYGYIDNTGNIKINVL